MKDGKKEVIVRLTAKDFRWDYYRGSGKGGQARNKTENCVRCTHEASGAVGRGEEGRSKDLNKRRAFEQCCNTPEFQKWIRYESMKRTGELAIIEAKVERQMMETVVESKVDGKWVKDPNLQVNEWDIKNIKE